MDETQIIKARLKDLAAKAYKQNIYTYSSFLNLSELDILEDVKHELSYVDISTYGGGAVCERQMVRFGSFEMFGYESQWPINIILAEPVLEKFSDELSHRDFLGALMNLGLERSVMGDILVKENKRAYIFCQDNIAEFIADNLSKIRHTNVKCTILPVGEDIEDLKPQLEDMSLIVAAPRFDAIVAAAAKLSRSESVNLFRAKKITLNGRINENNSMLLKDGDVFSVRGYGKFLFCGAGGETRKGRQYVHLKRYK